MLGAMCLVLSVLLFTTTLSEAQVLLRGDCPVVTEYAQKFDARSFSGTWYEMIRTKRWVGTEIECVTHDLQMNSRYNISYQTNSYSPHLDREFSEEGDAEVKLAPAKGTKTSAVVFDIEEYGTMNELLLLNTDYTSYAVLWSCTEADEDLHFENTMIWTRDRVPKAAALSRGLRVLDNNNLTRNYLTYTRHRSCPDFHRDDVMDVGKTTVAAATTGKPEPMSPSTIAIMPLMSKIMPDPPSPAPVAVTASSVVMSSSSSTVAATMAQNSTTASAH